MTRTIRTDGDVMTIARKLERLMFEMDDLYALLEASEHTNAQAIYEGLKEQCWFAAWPTHVVVSLLEHPDEWECESGVVRHKAATRAIHSRRRRGTSRPRPAGDAEPQAANDHGRARTLPTMAELDTGAEAQTVPAHCEQQEAEAGEPDARVDYAGILSRANAAFASWEAAGDAEHAKWLELCDNEDDAREDALRAEWAKLDEARRAARHAYLDALEEMREALPVPTQHARYGWARRSEHIRIAHTEMSLTIGRKTFDSHTTLCGKSGPDLHWGQRNGLSEWPCKKCYQVARRAVEQLAARTTPTDQEAGKPA